MGNKTKLVEINFIMDMSDIFGPRWMSHFYYNYTKTEV